VLDFADLTAPSTTGPQSGRVTIVTCPRCQDALRYRPFDRAFFVHGRGRAPGSPADREAPGLRAAGPPKELAELAERADFSRHSVTVPPRDDREAGRQATSSDAIRSGGAEAPAIGRGKHETVHAAANLSKHGSVAWHRPIHWRPRHGPMLLGGYPPLPKGVSA
jgi:hypothetical protein